MEESKCGLCGEPMPAGEEMFNYHGYSGPCPKPPLAKADTPQPMPTGDGQDVGREASRMLSGLGAVEIAADLEARIGMGEKKYGSRLKTNNGRNALMDAYQEALDGIHYACQYKMEGHSSEPLAGFIKVALALRRLLDQPRNP